MQSACATYFKPAGIPIHSLEEALLKADELEALRLADCEQLYHADAAKSMNISRQTFARILRRARNTVGRALVDGHALRIETPS